MTTTEWPSAQPLVESARRGDDRAFADLYALYADSTLRAAFRSSRDAVEAEDIRQEVWLRVQRGLARLRDAAAFPRWLRQLTARTCIDASRRRHAALPIDDAGEVADADPAPDDLLVESERGRIAWQALGTLPERQAQALILREVEGKDYKQIAVALGTSQAAVESLLFRARRSLAVSYGMLEASQADRCRFARAAMAAVLDGEKSAKTRRSLRAHLEECPDCRRQIVALRKSSAAIPFAWRVLRFSQAGPAMPAPVALTGAGSGFLGLQILAAGLVAGVAITAGVAVKASLLAGDSGHTGSSNPAATASAESGPTGVTTAQTAGIPVTTGATTPSANPAIAESAMPGDGSGPVVGEAETVIVSPEAPTTPGPATVASPGAAAAAPQSSPSEAPAPRGPGLGAPKEPGQGTGNTLAGLTTTVQSETAAVLPLVPPVAPQPPPLPALQRTLGSTVENAVAPVSAIAANLPVQIAIPGGQPNASTTVSAATAAVSPTVATAVGLAPAPQSPSVSVPATAETIASPAAAATSAPPVGTSTQLTTPAPAVAGNVPIPVTVVSLP